MNLYFAYGSNMNKKQMNDRCPSHTYFGHGILKGYRWIISERGYANVIQSEDDVVYGVVYRLNEEDEAALDNAEGVQKGSYRKEILPIEIEKTNYRCLVYIDPVFIEGEPKEEYIGRINRALADADLPEKYVERYIRRYIPAQR